MAAKAYDSATQNFQQSSFFCKSLIEQCSTCMKYIQQVLGVFAHTDKLSQLAASTPEA